MKNWKRRVSTCYDSRDRQGYSPRSAGWAVTTSWVVGRNENAGEYRLALSLFLRLSPGQPETRQRRNWSGRHAAGHVWWGFAGDKAHAHSCNSFARVLVRRHSALLRSAPLYLPLFIRSSNLTYFVLLQYLIRDRIIIYTMSLSHFVVFQWWICDCQFF